MAAERSVNILVVDDYGSMLRLLRNILRQLGFENVFEAADGIEALKILRTENIGLVISDWYMEPMSGIEFLREVRADKSLKNIPFIMITAERGSASVAAAHTAGVTNYIVKPFTTETLRSKVADVLGEI